MPRLFIISGCNGAGKTTASYSMLPEMLECYQYVNSDEFAKGLSPFEPEAASFKAGRFMLQKIDYLFKKRADFCIETTLATRSLLKMISEAKSIGYTVTVLYMWLESAELAISRIKARVEAGGHNIPDEIVRRRYRMGMEYLFYEYIPVCDRWILADNSNLPFTVVAEGNSELTHVRDTEKYGKIWDLAHRKHDIR